MNKFFALFFLIICHNFFSQGTRFIYEYQYAPDSLKIDSLTSELMYLSVFEDHSTFSSEDRADLDFYSQNIGELTKRKKKAMKLNVFTGMKITKKYPEFSICNSIPIGAKFFRVENINKFDWNIVQETKEYNQYKVQKAVTEFGNRKWTAWFASQIPLQEGPYKFAGLPGLIVSIEDESKSHIFNLVEVEKIKKIEGDDSTSNKKIKNNAELGNINFFKEYDASEDEMKKAWKTYQENPAQALTDFFNDMGLGNIGTQVIDAQKQRELNKSSIEKNKKYNNYIEKNLFK